MQRFNLSRRDDFQWQRATLSQASLDGMKIAVIGGTGGIGRALSRALAGKGAEVIVVGRSFRDEDVARTRFMRGDLTLMKNARLVAQQLPAESLDLLILTTGIMAGKQRVATSEGIEIDLAVSYLSRFVIIREVAERLGRNRTLANLKPRVFIMGFPGSDPQVNLDDFNSEQHYDTWIAHSNTVAGNEALVLDSATRYPHLSFYGLNPKFIKSNIRASALGEGTLRQKLVEGLIGVLMPSAAEYSEKILPLLISPDIEPYSGAMFNHLGDPIHASPSLTQTENVQKVIHASEALVSRILLPNY